VSITLAALSFLSLISKSRVEIVSLSPETHKKVQAYSPISMPGFISPPQSEHIPSYFASILFTM